VGTSSAGSGRSCVSTQAPELAARHTTASQRAVRRVRDADPNNSDPTKRARIVIHLANGGDNKLYRTVFDALTERRVDYDVIGLSYYSYWHGSLDDLKSNMNDISERYQILASHDQFPGVCLALSAAANKGEVECIAWRCITGSSEHMSRNNHRAEGRPSRTRNEFSSCDLVLFHFLSSFGLVFWSSVDLGSLPLATRGHL